jgi:hypothetical protein
MCSVLVLNNKAVHFSATRQCKVQQPRQINANVGYNLKAYIILQNSIHKYSHNIRMAQRSHIYIYTYTVQKERDITFLLTYLCDGIFNFLCVDLYLPTTADLFSFAFTTKE